MGRNRKKKRFSKACREQELTQRWKGEQKEVGTAWNVLLYGPKQARTIMMAHPCAMSRVVRVWSCPWARAQNSQFPHFPHRAPQHCAPALASSLQSDPPAPAKHKRFLCGLTAFQRVACGPQLGTRSHIFTEWYYVIFLQNEDSKEGRREQGEVQGR